MNPADYLPFCCSFHNYTGYFTTIDLGNKKPVVINQIKPGNLVKGIKNNKSGKTKLIQLSSPKMQSKIPGQISHFGKNFIKPAVTTTPAIRSPNGTEYPTPPTAKTK